MRSLTTFSIAAMLAAASMAGAMAQTSTSATANATIQPAGPRSSAGSIVTNYFNVEGNSNGKNASFGVADFIPTAAPTATSISNVSLALTESNAAFTTPGTFNIYLATNNTVPISTLKFDSTNLSTGGIGSQVGTLYTLGTATFSTTGNVNNGQVDIYALNFADPTAQNLFLNDVQSGSTIRLALGADTDATSATFAGNTNTKYAGPALTYTANAPVPEASTTASFGLLLALGLGGVAIARRRKSA